jgi:hypothetical protein
MMYGRLVKCVMEYKLTYAFYVLCWGFVRKLGKIIFLKQKYCFNHKMMYGHLVKYVMEHKLTYAFYVLCWGFVRKLGHKI